MGIKGQGNKGKKHPKNNYKKRKNYKKGIITKKRGIFLKKGLTKFFSCDIIADVNGASPSGKATDSDSVIT